MMPEKKNFLLLAIGVGVVCALIGTMTIWNKVVDIMIP